MDGILSIVYVIIGAFIILSIAFFVKYYLDEEKQYLNLAVGMLILPLILLFFILKWTTLFFIVFIIGIFSALLK